MWQHARNTVQISRETAAGELHIGARTLADYESGKTVPPPEVVLGMSRLYERPEMTQLYCRHYCSIGAAYSYDVLNAVNLDPASILIKLQTEMAEVQKIFPRMLEIIINKNQRDDFTPEEWSEFEDQLHELLDVEHCIETFKLTLGKWTDMAVMVAAHNQKCQDKKYVIKEKAAF